MAARVRQDLPLSLRRQITSADAAGTHRARGRDRTASQHDTPARPVPLPGAPVRCVPCGRTFPTYSKAQRHLDAAHRSGRIAVVLR
jgi:hypothetical protein